MDLDNLKYSELQKLAKTAGIRANQKVDKLVKALRDYYSSQECHAKAGKGIDKSETESGPSASSTEEDVSESPETNDEGDKAKKKPPSRGRKKGQKKGAKGKAKKNVSSDESQGDDDSKKVNKSYTISPKAPATQTTKGTPQAVPAAGKRTAKIVKPVLAGTPKIIAGKQRPAIISPLSARTPAGSTARTPSGSTASKRPAIVNRTPAGKPAPPAARRSVAVVNPSSSNSGARKVSASEAVAGLLSPKPRNSPRSQGAKGSPACGGEQKNATTATADLPCKTSGQKRQRKNTFELEEATLGAAATPEAERSTKRTRTSGTPVTVQHTPKSSPGVQGFLDSMSGEMSSAERRTRLMNAIEKKVEGKVKTSQNMGPATQIPRFAAFLAKRKQDQKKPVTPGNKDWDKVHKKAFSKFDSIDVYLEKKRKRAEEMTASVKKARTVLHEVQEAVTKLKTKRTPSLGKKKADQPFKPSVVSTKHLNLNFGATKTPTDKKAAAAPPPAKAFKPSVTSTKSMNINFSSFKTPVTGQAQTKLRTPAAGALSSRKSVGAAQMSARKSLGASAARKSMSTTPFHFTGNATTESDVNQSTSKAVFDLKASLARPITWKPHVGKLKPVNQYQSATKVKVETSVSKPAFANRMDIFKSAVNRTRITYSRHDRRAATAAKRAEKKDNLQMKRRGIPA